LSKEFHGEQPRIEDVLHDPAASFWLKAALRTALERAQVDAANDAEVLARVIGREALKGTERLIGCRNLEESATRLGKWHQAFSYIRIAISRAYN
jgi:hypothetical protein